jgi:hypothetical protein
MWLWTIRLMPSRPSRSGADKTEVTKAVADKGRGEQTLERPWWDPFGFFERGKVVVSFTEPFKLWVARQNPHHPWLLQKCGESGHMATGNKGITGC